MSEPMTSVPVPAAMPSVEEMLASYNAVWQHALGIDAHNAPIVRHEAMSAVLDLFAPILAEKERVDHECQASMKTISDLRSDLDAAEAALAGERERTVRDTLLHVRNLLAANQVPLGKDFEDVWNANARELYES